MMRNIRLTMVQMSSLAGEPEKNLESMLVFVDNNRDSDIICFPEMCLSGYSTNDAETVAISPDHECVRALLEKSKETGTAIVFGFVEQRDGFMSLRQEIADGSNERKFYRKTHLGKRESEVFRSGDELPVFDVKGVKVGIQLCIESHINDICTVYRSKGAELVLTPFATGISTRRKETWARYLPARAYDNGMYVAACSCVGDNGRGAKFGGGLIIIDPRGRTVAEYYGEDEMTITAEIGGELPRDGADDMKNISFFDRRRPELY